MMADEFLNYLQQGNPILDEQLATLKSLVKEIKLRRGKPDLMAEAAVQWVQQNPEPLKMKTPKYTR